MVALASANTFLAKKEAVVKAKFANRNLSAKKMLAYKKAKMAKRNLQDTDKCFIHKGCEAAEWQEKEQRWFCADGKSGVHGFGDYDLCDVHTGCTDGISYDKTTFTWRCNDDFARNLQDEVEMDPCSIHSGCTAGAEWFADEGEEGMWRCSESPMASGGFGGHDRCMIHKGCTDGAGWDKEERTWKCNDELSRNLQGKFDACFITKGCTGGVEYTGKQWQCKSKDNGCGSWGCKTGDFDKCEITPGCDSGASYDTDNQVWKCNSDM
jgi:hypothetical protein